MPQTRSRSVFLLALGALLAIGGGHTLWTEGVRAVHAQRVSQWPLAHGEVIYSGAERLVAPRQRHLGLWTSPTHRAVVRYRYAVGGTPYLSERVARARGSARAREEAARYAVGRAVRVRFDPLQPGHAVLESGSAPGLWRLGAGALALLAGLGCVAGAGLSRRPSPRASPRGADLRPEPPPSTPPS